MARMHNHSPTALQVSNSVDASQPIARMLLTRSTLR
jgi:hypothetical protein